MVPDRVRRKPLGLLFAKYFCVMLVASGDLLLVDIFVWWVQRDSAYEVLIIFDRSRSVDASGKELSSLRVRAPEYDWEVSVIDPTSFPIYFRLCGCEPWVAKNGFVFAEVGKEELKRDGGRSGPDVQDSVIVEVSASVFCSVDVEQFAGFWELFNREF